MNVVRNLVALSVATLAAACASPGYMTTSPASAGAAPMAMGATGPMAAMEPRMKAMREMHQKMAKAAPGERQALMADHMKAMQGGMAMMKEMHSMQAGSGTGAMGMMGSHGGGAPMADMVTRHQMMADHMAMMQMMMNMMADRMPPAAVGPMRAAP